MNAKASVAATRDWAWNAVRPITQVHEKLGHGLALRWRKSCVGPAGGFLPHPQLPQRLAYFVGEGGDFVGVQTGGIRPCIGVPERLDQALLDRDPEEPESDRPARQKTRELPGRPFALLKVQTRCKVRLPGHIRPLMFHAAHSFSVPARTHSIHGE
jgi:hypothetical protein